MSVSPRSRAMRSIRAAAGFGVLSACIACQRVGVAPPTAPVVARACPAPNVDVSDWALLRDSSNVAFRMPSDFVPRPTGDEPYREWNYAGDPSGRISIGFSPSREHWLTLRRVPSPGMHEMSECIDTLADRQVLLQAWRTENGIFRQGRRYDLFEMLALVEVEPSRTLFVTGGGSDPRLQELLLAIARTVTIVTP